MAFSARLITAGDQDHFCFNRNLRPIRRSDEERVRAGEFGPSAQKIEAAVLELSGAVIGMKLARLCKPTKPATVMHVYYGIGNGYADSSL